MLGCCASQMLTKWVVPLVLSAGAVGEVVTGVRGRRPQVVASVHFGDGEPAERAPVSIEERRPIGEVRRRGGLPHAGERLDLRDEVAGRTRFSTHFVQGA